MTRRFYTQFHVCVHPQYPAAAATTLVVVSGILAMTGPAVATVIQVVAIATATCRSRAEFLGSC